MKATPTEEDLDLEVGSKDNDCYDDDEAKGRARLVLSLTDDEASASNDDDDGPAESSAERGAHLLTDVVKTESPLPPVIVKEEAAKGGDDQRVGTITTPLPTTSLRRQTPQSLSIGILGSPVGAISVPGMNARDAETDDTVDEITANTNGEETSPGVEAPPPGHLREATAIDAELAFNEQEMQEAKEIAEAERDALKERLEKLENGAPSSGDLVMTVAVAEKESDGRKRRLCLVIAAALLVAATVVAVVLGVTLSGDDNKSDEGTDDINGSTAPVFDGSDSKDTPTDTLALPATAPLDTFMGNIVFNEIADVGNSMVCSQNADKWDDYLEFKNIGTEAIDLAGLTLMDDKLRSKSEQRVLPTGTIIEAGKLLVLCRGETLEDADFIFGIGGDDTLFLVHTPTNTTIAEVGPMSRMGSAVLTYQRLDDGSYDYFYPTPGEETTGEREPPFGVSNTTSQAISTFNVTEPSQPPLLALPTYPVEYYQDGVVINEVADRGNPNVCIDSADYVELKNIGTSTVDITGLVMYDDDGITSGTAFVFPANATKNILNPNDIMVWCQAEDFPFKIGGSDTVTLFHLDSGLTISVAGPMTRGGNATSTFQRKQDGSYDYATPTPNAENGW